jgi:alpha-galactosidase
LLISTLLDRFKSSTGFSSHFYNPFFALLSTSTTESQGEAWGFSLVYSGSFAVTVEKGGQGFTRAQIGLNSNQLSWPLRPNETLTSPECVSVYSKDGTGGMSRSLHGLYRNHLMKSQFATSIRPVLLNSWEALYYNLDQTKIFQMALESAGLGVKLFVLDDGWFGDKHPRLSDTAGLGDWVPNPMRFPNGLGPMVKEITALKPQNSSTNMRFGLWIEPEMVNPKSSLCEEHPEWILHAGQYPRTEQRNQLILNLALAEVQDHIINSISDVLLSADITYIKWDHNRCIHEAPSSSSHHAYMLGVYRIFEELTSRFPNILWEGCASGGGRCDPGVLQYFPQVWTSDNTDALERIFIQFGASIVYPASAMSGHISAVPNHQTGRTIPLTFRAHVAMMCGSFGFELNPAELLPHEKSALPQIIALSEKINPIVVNGNLWRLSLPEDSNWPAMMFVSQDGSQAVLFYFQIRSLVNHAFPRLKLQGLHAHSMYFVDGEGPFSGQTLMNLGLQYSFESDYGSRVILLEQQHTS